MSAPTEEEMRAGFHKATAGTEAERGAREAKPAAAEKKPNGGVKQLRSMVDRIVRLEEEKAETAGAIKEIYEEAKSAGYSKKAFRIVVKREMEDAEQRASRVAVEQEAELMIAGLGDFASSPLGEAAVGRSRH